MIYHVADEPIDLVQRCVRCRAILTDNNGLQVAGDDKLGPMYFPAYRLIQVNGISSSVADDASADDVRRLMCKSTEVFQ